MQVGVQIPIHIRLVFCFFLRQIQNCASSDLLFQGSLDNSKAESMVKNLQMSGRYLRDVW